MTDSVEITTAKPGLYPIIYIGNVVKWVHPKLHRIFSDAKPSWGLLPQERYGG